jgi:UDP-glucose 4-epimerase
MSKRALVTGGAGFIGSAVVRRLLERDWTVTVFDDFSNGHRSNLDDVDVEVIVGDIRDREAIHAACTGMDAVFHMAAVVGNVRSIEEPYRDAEVNMLGTVNVLQAAVAGGVPRLVYSSSAANYGETEEAPVREDHPQEPVSPYGASKLAAEKHALALGRIRGMRVVALRYFNVFGTRQRNDAYGNVIPIFAARALAGEPLTIFGDGQQTRDFVTVEDIAVANVLAAESAGDTAVYNVATGRPTTITAIADMVLRITGSSSVVTHVAPRAGEVRHCTADISAVQRDLGFEPSTDLEDSVARYIEWVRVAEPV